GPIVNPGITTPGRPVAATNRMGLVSKLSPDGSQLLFSNTVGGDGTPAIPGIAVDPVGNIYVTGINDSGNFPQTRPPFAQPGVTSANGSPTFIQAIAADSSHYIYAAVFLVPGSGQFFPLGLAVDRSGAVY